MIEVTIKHSPVLLQEALVWLAVRPGGVYVDCTAGMGGHSGAILAALEGRGRLIAVDRDAQALEYARARFLPEFQNVEFYHENFKNLPLILRNLGISAIDGCLLDLGVSSLQLESAERGFSFRMEGPLDMRMDADQSITAAHLVNELEEEELARIFREYGEEPASRKIARAIVEQRRLRKFRTTTELAELVANVTGKHHSQRIHPATRIFQALRIKVNEELGGLQTFLEQVIEILNPGGRLVVISFHSLEDRIVKRTFQRESGRCVCFRPAPLCTCPRLAKVEILTRKPVRPTPGEVEVNPRSRSARLRAVARLAI